MQLCSEGCQEQNQSKKVSITACHEWFGRANRVRPQPSSSGSSGRRRRQQASAAAAAAASRRQQQRIGGSSSSSIKAAAAAAAADAHPWSGCSGGSGWATQVGISCSAAQQSTFLVR